MACYTMIEVEVDDNLLNRRARKALGLKESGPLTQSQADAVRVEAGLIKSIDEIRRLNPRALIRRKDNELTVTVMQG